IIISVAAWWYFNTLFLFFFIPFIPFLFRSRSTPSYQQCPECGFQTTDQTYEYCPRDGTPLQER
ncbi:MAG: hypothetical protein ABEI86_09160, partial [Halobacteriaceae archaeon]